MLLVGETTASDRRDADGSGGGGGDAADGVPGEGMDQNSSACDGEPTDTLGSGCFIFLSLAMGLSPASSSPRPTSFTGRRA